MAITAHVHGDGQPSTKRFQSSNTNGLSSAVLVENAVLAHSTQLLPDLSVGAGHDDQIHSVLRQLEAMMKSLNARRTDVVKLNVYLSEDLPQATFMQSLREWMPTESAPAVSFVNTVISNGDADIALDAVFVASFDDPISSPKHCYLESPGGDPRTSRVSVLPKGDVLYVSGQAEQGDLPTSTQETLAGLLRTLEHLGLTRDHIVSLKCFMQPMSEVDVVNEQIAEFFGGAMIPPVSHVEWISSEKQPIEIELVAWAPPVESEDTVSYYWLPWLSKSPVYCRATRIHGDRRIFVSGLHSEKPGNGEQQVRSIFSQLENILSETGSDLRHLAKATYYVSDADPSAQLNKLRPEYYDPERPPAASKVMVSGVGHPQRGITIDMIAAPTH
ncbi:MAG: RidA family protein [Planctomycetaceae bacterium]|nr:RidA family protein [Planctomycetaceae bacterium]